MKEAGDTL